MKSLTIIIALFFISFQEPLAFTLPDGNSSGKADKSFSLPRTSDFNTWNLGAHLGFTYPNTDIAGNQNFGFGADVSKFFSHSFALQARIMHATLSGVDINRPQYQYKTIISYDFTLNAVVQMGNISFIQGKRDAAFYVSAGFGWMLYSPKVYLDGGRIPLTGIYSQYTAPFDTMYYQANTDFVIPLGVGLKYRAHEKYSLTFEYCIRRTYTDKLDGFFKLLSADDNYSYLSIGFAYHLGSKDKVLEWVNPLYTAYSDLYDLKAGVEQMKKDSDKDGVADVYDHDNKTPEGVKVYGDGTAIDSDEDGLPDYKDADPFSSKYAVVDATGKEIPGSEAHVKKEIINLSEKDRSNVVGENSQPVVSNQKQETISDTNKGITALSSPKENITPSFINAINDSLPSIYFNMNEDLVARRHKRLLGNIAMVMMLNPRLNFRIIGITDASGSANYNIQLGKRRAISVKRHLINEYNIKPDRLTIETKGQKISNNIPASEYRRVDFKAIE